MNGRAASYAQRLRTLAEETGRDPQRLRRSLVFQRILVRIGASEKWVLKGGFCLEVRLELAARATVDLDLVTADSWASNAAHDLQDALDELLEPDVEHDGFSFLVGVPRSVSTGGQRSAWRVSVEARVGGDAFAQIRLDVVSQFRELAGGTERLRVKPPLSGLGLGDAEVMAVGVDQHAAEKLHALARTYAGDRPSSRVKDLVDLVLLIEADVLDPVRLRARLLVVYRERDDAKPPQQLPPPPATWAEDYVALLRRNDLDVVASTCAAAHHLVSTTYAETLATDPDGGTSS